MGDFLSGIGDFLGGIASAVVADIVAIAEWLYQLVVFVAGVLAQWLEALGQYVLQGLQQIGKFFQHVWDTFFKGLWRRLLSILKSSQVWNDLRHGHILAFLRDLRKLLDAIFAQFIRPILNMLQHVRQVLLILRALHIGFAAKLDAWIAQTEARIVQAFATVRATVNLLVDVVNALADPQALLRKPALLLSIRRALPALIRIVTGRPPGYFFPSPRGSKGGAFAPVESNFVASDPAHNPPASSYMGFNDGVPADPPIDIGYTISVTAVDQTDVLDYFNDSLYPAPLCTDPVQCLNQSIQLLVPKVTHG